GGAKALHYFRLGKVAPDETVLINGASGAVGTVAVQLAKHLGAEVTAVCSGPNTDLVKELGADHVIDYTTEDFTRNGQRYDVVMDNHGNAPYGQVKASLTPGGRFLMVVGNLWQMLAAAGQKATITGSAAMDADSYQAFMSLAERRVLRPVIDSLLPFPQNGRGASAGRRCPQGGERCCEVSAFRVTRATSVTCHEVDAVVFPCALGYLNADAVTDVRSVDGLVLELHRPDPLAEVGVRTCDSYRVPNT